MVIIGIGMVVIAIAFVVFGINMVIEDYRFNKRWSNDIEYIRRCKERERRKEARKNRKR